MKKVDLVNTLANRANITKAQAETVLSALFGKYGPNSSEPGIISDELAAGGEVSLVGFGSFKVNEKKAREGRNPRTGEVVSIAARKSPAFKAGSALKKEVQ